MNFMSVVSAAWRGPKLDSSRTRAARAEFDDDGKYDAWERYCRGQSALSSTAAQTSELAQSGFEIVTLLTPPKAAAAKSEILAMAKEASPAKAEIDYADVLRFQDNSFLRPVVEEMLSPEISAKIMAIYGSHFYVHTVTVNRTMPSKASKRSFLWHCDRGPYKFLKINMFLDSTRDHGSTTEFVDLEQSEIFERSGYTFGPNKSRVADLKSLTGKVGIEPKVTTPELDAGQAFIFFPARVLHRGCLPTHGIRHMMSLILLPSPVHWTEAWNAKLASGFRDYSDVDFPASAEQLFDGLSLPRRPL